MIFGLSQDQKWLLHASKQQPSIVVEVFCSAIVIEEAFFALAGE